MARKTKATTTAVLAPPKADYSSTPHFSEAAESVLLTFANVIRSGQPLFRTDAQELWESYLSSFPPESRQEHDCYTCRRFINEYGGLAIINEDGTLTPAMWDGTCGVRLYYPGIRIMHNKVVSASVTGLYLTDSQQWGLPVTKTGAEWHHFSVTPAKSMLFMNSKHNQMRTAGQIEAEKCEDFRNVMRALGEFPMGAVASAVELLESEALYRSEKLLGAAKWLLDLHQIKKDVRNAILQKNLLWRKVAEAPSGFCHPRSGIIGTLLEDIIALKPMSVISRNFAEKMNPLQYQRPQAAPSAGNIEQAEKLVEKMGIANSLKRRFLRMDEVQALWRPEAPAPSTGGVFSHLKQSEGQAGGLVIPKTVMTWVKFLETILPEAAGIDLWISAAKNNYVGLVTAADPSAPPIIQWDTPEARNPVSWYLYAGGSSPSYWGLNEALIKVAAVCLQPSQWTGVPAGHLGEGVMFLLDNAWDRQHKFGNFLFPEILKSELHSVRATIEAYSKTAPVEGGNAPVACGLAISKGSRFLPVHLNVKMRSGTLRRIELDRWD